MYLRNKLWSSGTRRPVAPDRLDGLTRTKVLMTALDSGGVRSRDSAPPHPSFERRSNRLTRAAARASAASSGELLTASEYRHADTSLEHIGLR